MVDLIPSGSREPARRRRPPKRGRRGRILRDIHTIASFQLIKDLGLKRPGLGSVGAAVLSGTGTKKRGLLGPQDPGLLASELPFRQRYSLESRLNHSRGKAFDTQRIWHPKQVHACVGLSSPAVTLAFSLAKHCFVDHWPIG